MKRIIFVLFAAVLLTSSCNQPWRKYSEPELRAYIKDSLKAMDLRSADILSAAYMAQTLIGEKTDIPGWEGYPVKEYEYYTLTDIKSFQKKKGKVYMLNPSPRQLSMWIITAVWEAKGKIEYTDIDRISKFIKWQSGAQFPVKGVVYEDMYTMGFYEPYVFKDGVTVYVADPKMFPEDKTCTEEQLDFYLNMTNADLKPNTGRYARICSTNRDMYYAAGGKMDVGDNNENRSQAWLDVVRLLYQKAWRSDKNDLIIAWAKSNL